MEAADRADYLRLLEKHRRAEGEPPMRPGAAPASFRGVQEEMTGSPPDVPEVRQRKPIRIKPEHAERLRQAKLDYAGRRRIETDETAILAQFIDDKLEEWLAERLPASQSEPKRKAARGKDGE